MARSRIRRISASFLIAAPSELTYRNEARPARPPLVATRTIPPRFVSARITERARRSRTAGLVRFGRPEWPGLPGLLFAGDDDLFVLALAVDRADRGPGRRADRAADNGAHRAADDAPDDGSAEAAGHSAPDLLVAVRDALLEGLPGADRSRRGDVVEIVVGLDRPGKRRIVAHASCLLVWGDGVAKARLLGGDFHPACGQSRRSCSNAPIEAKPSGGTRAGGDYRGGYRAVSGRGL